MSRRTHRAGTGPSNTTDGPIPTSEGPPGHYVGRTSPSGGGRRVTIVGGGGLHHHPSLVERQSSFASPHGHLPMDHEDMFAGRGLAEDLLSSHRRDPHSRDLESTTAVLDAAILDLTRRRLAMSAPAPGTSEPPGAREEAKWEPPSTHHHPFARSASSLAARQQQLQQQQMDLEQRQRELEIQRQQLMAGMQEHAKSTSLLAAQNSGHSNTNASQQQWWVCQVCNSKAFASHDEAMQHELSCCPEPQKFDTMAAAIPAMPIPSDHHIFPGYPCSPSHGLDSGLDLMPPSHSFIHLKEPIPLSMNSDKDWLTPLHCFVRRHCVEVFTATDKDVATPSKGKRKPIQVGQVGIRCPHCHSKDFDGKPRERGSVYYPTSISSVYNATMNLLQRHLHNCSAVPAEVMRRYETLKSDDARSGTSKRYWIESSISLGLVDTSHGIRFSALSPPPLPSLNAQQSTGSFGMERRNSNDFFSNSSNAVVADPLNGDPASGRNSPQLDPPDTEDKDAKDDKKERNKEAKDGKVVKAATPAAAAAAGVGAAVDIPVTEQSLAESAILVEPEDEPYSTKFSFHLISQMQPCVFTEADRLGKRKGLPTGFAGLACRHCFGGYGSGRFFPSSIKTLSDTSKTLNVLHNHMQRCRKCPQEIRETLDRLRATHDDERGNMKFGSQKAFFARVWERLHKHGTPPVPKKKPKRKAANPPGDYTHAAMTGYPMVTPAFAMDSRYFHPLAPDNFSGHISFSGLDAHTLDMPEAAHKRRRST